MTMTNAAPRSASRALSVSTRAGTAWRSYVQSAARARTGRRAQCSCPAATPRSAAHTWVPLRNRVASGLEEAGSGRRWLSHRARAHHGRALASMGRPKPWIRADRLRLTPWSEEGPSVSTTLARGSSAAAAVPATPVPAPSSTNSKPSSLSPHNVFASWAMARCEAVARWETGRQLPHLRDELLRVVTHYPSLHRRQSVNHTAFVHISAGSGVFAPHPTRSSRRKRRCPG